MRVEPVDEYGSSLRVLAMGSDVEAGAAYHAVVLLTLPDEQAQRLSTVLQTLGHT